MFGVFFVIVLASSFVAITLPSTFRYAVSMQIGRGLDGNPIETPEALAARVQAMVLPRFIRQEDASVKRLADIAESLDYIFPKGGALLTISGQTSRANEPFLNEMLRGAVNAVLAEHSKELERVKVRLTRELEAAEAAAAREDASKLRAAIDGLVMTRSVGPERSIRAVGPNRIAIIILGILLAIAGAVVVALASEFSAHVRARLRALG